MSLHYICNPAVVPNQPNILEFILLEESSLTISAGDEGFVRGLLNDLELQQVGLVSWEMLPVHTNFYSENPEADDWFELWPLARRVRVVTDTDLTAKLPPIETSLIESDALEGSRVSSLLAADELPRTCLVIVVFESSEDLQQALNAIKSDAILAQMRQLIKAPEPIFTELPLTRSSESPLVGYRQLYIDLGQFPNKFFEDGAVYAERVIEISEDAGNAFITYLDLEE